MHKGGETEVLWVGENPPIRKGVTIGRSPGPGQVELSAFQIQCDGLATIRDTQFFKQVSDVILDSIG